MSEEALLRTLSQLHGIVDAALARYSTASDRRVAIGHAFQGASHVLCDLWNAREAPAAADSPAAVSDDGPSDLAVLEWTVEEGNQLLCDLSIGLAWAAGDAEPPRHCSPDCTMPHLGEKAHAAIRDGMEAIRAATWTPPQPERRP